MTVYVVALAADDDSRLLPTYRLSSMLLHAFLKANDGLFVEWMTPATDGIVKIDIDESLVEMLEQEDIIALDGHQPMIGTSAYIIG